MTDFRVQNLTKSFGGHPVLRGVDLTVESGRLVAILGASGSGKTTLLRLLAGFERPDAGSIRLGGEIVAGEGKFVPPERRHIGYVAQEGMLFPHLSVAGNVTFGLAHRQRKARHRVAELLELVGLSESFADRPPHQLSGGEQQRVALARALAPEPALVLLDEPFSSLDAALRAETREAVARAVTIAGATTLLVTHDQDEALSMGHEVAVLRDGRLVQTGTPEALYRRPADAALARFVGEAVLLPGTAADGFAQCRLGRLKLDSLMPEGNVEVLIRPEQIRLHREDEAGGGGVRARVLDISFFGHDASARLVLEGPEPVEVTARMPGHRSPRPGEGMRLIVEGVVATFPGGDGATAPFDSNERETVKS